MIERSYPGVYVTEIALRAQSIEGVPTREAPPLTNAAVARTQDLAAPGWTEHNVHDPGVTLVQLFAFLAESQLFGPVANNLVGVMVHAQPGLGIAQGLAVDAHDGGAPSVKVTPGQALSADGTPAGPHGHAHHIRKP